MHGYANSTQLSSRLRLQGSNGMPAERLITVNVKVTERLKVLKGAKKHKSVKHLFSIENGVFGTETIGASCSNYN